MIFLNSKMSVTSHGKIVPAISNLDLVFPVCKEHNSPLQEPHNEQSYRQIFLQTTRFAPPALPAHRPESPHPWKAR